MIWTKTPPALCEYYWAIPKDKNLWMDGTAATVVKQFSFNGGVPGYVYIVGDNRQYTVSDFEWWSDEPVQYIPYPKGFKQ